MNKNKLILQKFKKLNCIIDENKLEEYINFCISHNVRNKIKGISSTHHILPRAKTLPFKKYADLSENEWNKSELTYYDHYIAHYLLTLAVDHISVYSAFCGMHNKDGNLKRIHNDNLITEKEFNEIYTRRNILISEYNKELIVVNQVTMTRAKYRASKVDWSNANKLKSSRMKIDNIMHHPGVLEKMRKIKSETFINGKNLDQLGAIKAAETMKKSIQSDDGTITSIYKESAKKISKTLNTEIIIDGRITTLAKERGKRNSQTQRSKGIFYILKNVNDSLYFKKLSAAELRNVSPGLSTKSKDNFLGKSKYAQTILKKRDKSHLIGLYVEIL